MFKMGECMLRVLVMMAVSQSVTSSAGETGGHATGPSRYQVFARHQEHLLSTEVSAGANVAELKDAILTAMGARDLSLSNITVRYQDTELQSETMLADIGIGPETVVEIVDAQVTKADMSDVTAHFHSGSPYLPQLHGREPDFEQWFKRELIAKLGQYPEQHAWAEVRQDCGAGGLWVVYKHPDDHYRVWTNEDMARKCFTTPYGKRVPKDVHEALNLLKLTRANRRNLFSINVQPVEREWRFWWLSRWRKNY